MRKLSFGAAPCATGNTCGLIFCGTGAVTPTDPTNPGTGPIVLPPPTGPITL